MKLGHPVFCLTALLIGGFAPKHATAAPTAEEIMSRANKRVQSAKTYTATWEMRTRLGEMSPALQTMRVERIPGRKSRITIRETGIQMVDDGKVLYLYSSKLNQYTRRPSRILADGAGPIGASGTSSQQRYKLEGTTTIRGMRCFTIRIAPRKLPPGVIAPDVRAYVDTSGYRLVRTVSTVQRPGSDAAPLPLTQTIDIISETMNAPIDEAIFRFSPPRGATQAQPQAGARK